MKAVVLILSLVAVSQAAVLPRGLYDDFQDFKALLPLDKLKEIYDYYVENDEAVAAVVEYVQSDEAKAALEDVKKLPGVQELVQFVKDNWQTSEVQEGRKFLWRYGVGFDAFLNDFLDALPLDKMWDLAFTKLKAGGAFAELYHKLRASKNLYYEVCSLPSVAKVLVQLRAYGVDVDRFDDFFHYVLGW